MVHLQVESTRDTSMHSVSANSATSSSASSGGGGDGEVYCFCRRPYDPTVDVFMICCDVCDEWYHGSCVGVNQREAKKIARYVCPRCKKIPISPPTTTSTTSSSTSSEVSSEGEPTTPPSSRSKKRKEENNFKNESASKRQAISPTNGDHGVVC